jgi:hypothetical protein
LKEKEKQRIQQLKDEAKSKKLKKITKLESEIKKVESESESESEADVIIKKKKKKPVKKVKYESDDDSEPKRNVIIINNGKTDANEKPVQQKNIMHHILFKFFLVYLAFLVHLVVTCAVCATAAIGGGRLILLSYLVDNYSTYLLYYHTYLHFHDFLFLLLM